MQTAWSVDDKRRVRCWTIQIRGGQWGTFRFVSPPLSNTGQKMGDFYAMYIWGKCKQGVKEDLLVRENTQMFKSLCYVRVSNKQESPQKWLDIYQLLYKQRYIKCLLWKWTILHREWNDQSISSSHIKVALNNQCTNSIFYFAFKAHLY